MEKPPGTGRKMIKSSFFNALDVAAYITVVATLMQNGDKVFGAKDNFFSPIAFLLLFTFSAVTVGGLILGKPLMAYIDGYKKEAIAMFLQTAGWLAVFTVIALVVTALI